MALSHVFWLLPIIVAAVVIVRWRRRGERMTLVVAPNHHVGVVAIARHTSRWRIIGATVGVAAAALLATNGASLGRAMLLAPMTAGAGVLLGVIIGEWTARPPRGIARTATLRRRTLRDVLPQRSRVRLVVGVLSAGVVLAAGTFMGSADDLGRAGRSLTRTCTVLINGELAEVSSSRGPWPGSYYAIPAAAALLVVLILAAVAARAIVARQRPSAEDADLDDQLRRWSVMRVAAATDATMRFTAAPLALLMAMMLRANAQFDDCRHSVDQPLMWVLVALGVYWLLTGWIALLDVFVGARIIVDEPAAPTPPADAHVPVR